MHFLHTSDVHLHPDRPERLEALRLVWQQAIERRCDILLIAGDLFDSREAADRLRPQVRELFESRSDLRVVIVVGNYDADAYPSGADYGSNVLVVTKPSTLPVSDEIDLVAVPYSFDLRPSEILRSLKLPSDRRAILLTHGSFFADQWAHVYRGLQQSGEGNDFAWFPQDVADKGFGYVALGHWHQPTTPMLHYGDTVVAYSGTPCSIARDEVGCRRVVFVESDGAANFQCHFVELAQAPHCLHTFQDETLRSGAGTAAETFCTITQRYVDVRYDKRERQFLVQSEDGQWFREDQLSTGARAQLLFSLRIAFVRRLFGNEKGFLILDDAFLSYDAERKPRAIRIMTDLAQQGWQVLYYTLDPFTRDLFFAQPGAEVVTLQELTNGQLSPSLRQR